MEFQGADLWKPKGNRALMRTGTLELCLEKIVQEHFQIGYLPTHDHHQLCACINVRMLLGRKLECVGYIKFTMIKQK